MDTLNNRNWALCATVPGGPEKLLPSPEIRDQKSLDGSAIIRSVS